MYRALFFLTILVLPLASCTENERAKRFGGTMNVDVPCGKKLFDLTWKGDSLWYATRPMRADEKPETYSFVESSSYGMMEGVVSITECR